MDKYPWHVPQWRVVREKMHLLPQAILIVANRGTGKLGFASRLAELLLCEADDELRPCQDCKSCNMNDGGHHPDLHVLTTEAANETAVSFLGDHVHRYGAGSPQKKSAKSNPSSIINVEQVRSVSRALQMTSVRGGNRVCLLSPADALNINAANALLKILEEPLPGTYFLLLTSELHSLPATVRSRCSRLKLQNPSLADSTAWLEASEEIDSDLARSLLTCGFGPFEVQQMFRSGSPDKLAAFASELAGLVSRGEGPELIVARLMEIERPLGLRLIQQQLVKALRISVGCEEPNDRLASALRVGLGIRGCNRLFTKIGQYLRWPNGAVDERLFLEDIACGLSQPGVEGG